MLKTVKQSYVNIDKVVIAKNYVGYPLVQFYMQYDPATYQKEGSPKDAAYGGFGKFYFSPKDCPSWQTQDKFPKGLSIIYVNRGTCPRDWRYRETIIHRSDNSPAFKLVYATAPTH